MDRFWKNFVLRLLDQSLDILKNSKDKPVSLQECIIELETLIDHLTDTPTID